MTPKHEYFAYSNILVVLTIRLELKKKTLERLETLAKSVNLKKREKVKTGSR